MNSDFYQKYLTVVNTLAAEYHRRYSMVEPADIAQTLWVWFVTHPNKYKEWSSLEQKDKDKLIAKSLRNAAITFCEKEKAKVAGYEILDLYYYDSSVIEAFLPSIISESYEIPQKIKDLNFKFSKGETNDGNNWLVLRADIAAAYYKLSEAKQNVLRIKFSTDNQEWSALASELNTTPDGARMKVQRAINSLIKILGGFKPRIEEDGSTESVEEDSDE
jgi:hypothetical protein